MRISVIQMNSIDDARRNREAIAGLVERAAADRAELVALPEAAWYRGPSASMPREPFEGETLEFVSGLARRHRIWIHGGSFAEDAGDGRAFNTALIVDPAGRPVLKYRKVHLFDIDLKDNVNAVQESRHYAPGDATATVRIGEFLASTLICYDLRFSEIWTKLRLAGVDLFFLPSNFTKTTGRAHWETLIRARAIECQSYVAAPAQWGDHPGQTFSAHGRAMIVSPWGEVLAAASEEGDAVVTADIDRATIDEVRAKMPTLSHRRPEVYRG